MRDLGFAAAFDRELAQRADAPGADAALHAAARACREALVERWIRTQAADARRPPAQRRVHYLSMEFLMGRALGNAWRHLASMRPSAPTLASLGIDAAALVEREPDAAPRQRRPGSPGGVLPRLVRHARPAVLRLRPALRVRHVRAGHRRRPPGRAARRLAAPWQPLGDPAPGTALRGRLWRTCRARRLRAPLGACRARHRPGLRLHRARPWHRSRVDAAPVAGAGRGRDRLRRVLPRRAPGRGPRPPARRHAELGAVPRRQHRGRSRAAAEAGVPARQRVAAGHDRPPPARRS